MNVNRTATSEDRFDGLLGRNIAWRWTGAPVQGLVFRQADAALIPFSLVWLAFAIFWETEVIRIGAPLLMRIWGIPFVVIGVFFVAGRFLVDAYLRAHTVYGISDSDAYIVRDGLFSRVVSFNLRSTTPIEMKQRRDGSGTLSFGPSPDLRSGTAVWGVGSLRSFEGIADVAEVYQLVRTSD